MWGFIIDHLESIIIGGGVGIALLIGMIQRFRERRYWTGNEKADVLGTAGKAMGNAIYRGMPTDITGMPPSGRFQKPDFSYDEQQEQEYAERHEMGDEKIETLAFVHDGKEIKTIELE